VDEDSIEKEIKSRNANDCVIMYDVHKVEATNGEAVGSDPCTGPGRLGPVESRGPVPARDRRSESPNHSGSSRILDR